MKRQKHEHPSLSKPVYELDQDSMAAMPDDFVLGWFYHHLNNAADACEKVERLIPDVPTNTYSIVMLIEQDIITEEEGVSWATCMALEKELERRGINVRE